MVSVRTGDRRGENCEPMTRGTAAPAAIGTGASRGRGGVERIVVALRDGPGAELLLRRAAALSGRGGSAELLCVHVIRADGRCGCVRRASSWSCAG